MSITIGFKNLLFGHKLPINLKKCYSSTRISVQLPQPLSHCDPGQASRVENFRCKESLPSKHRLNDVGKFYTIPDEHSSRMFTNDWNVNLFSRQYMRHMKAFNERCVMIRRPGLEVVNYLKNANYDLPANKYLLYGTSGSGKSMVLQYAVHYAMSQEWLVMPCMFTWDWIRFHTTNKELKKQEVMKSHSREGYYDQPDKAQDWLKTFKLVNGNTFLSSLKTTQTYQWSLRDSTPEGFTFLQMVDLGIARQRYAPDVFAAIVNEVLTQDSTTFPKTLVAVDDVNAMFYPLMGLKQPFGVIPTLDEMSYFSDLSKLLSNKWKNGAVVTAVSTTNPIFTYDVEEYPYDALTSHGYNVLDPHIPIEVGNYTEKEILCQLAYYKDRKWLTGASLTEAGEAELIQTCAHNPRGTAKLCAHLP